MTIPVVGPLADSVSPHRVLDAEALLALPDEAVDVLLRLLHVHAGLQPHQAVVFLNFQSVSSYSS